MSVSRGKISLSCLGYRPRCDCSILKNSSEISLYGQWFVTVPVVIFFFSTEKWDYIVFVLLCWLTLPNLAPSVDDLWQVVLINYVNYISELQISILLVLPNYNNNPKIIKFKVKNIFIWITEWIVLKLLSLLWQVKKVKLTSQEYYSIFIVFYLKCLFEVQKSKYCVYVICVLWGWRVLSCAFKYKPLYLSNEKILQ